jgi:hypothetical protein
VRDVREHPLPLGFHRLDPLSRRGQARGHRIQLFAEPPEFVVAGIGDSYVEVAVPDGARVGLEDLESSLEATENPHSPERRGDQRARKQEHLAQRNPFGKRGAGAGAQDDQLPGDLAAGFHVLTGDHRQVLDRRPALAPEPTRAAPRATRRSRQDEGPARRLEGDQHSFGEALVADEQPRDRAEVFALQY